MKKLGATYKGRFLFRVQAFSHPLNKNNTRIRIRDEGYRVTMTLKSDTDKQFVTENEGCKIFIGLGCEKKYYYLWHPAYFKYSSC